MNKLKIFAIVSVSVAVLLITAVIIPAYMVDEGVEIYSPVGVNKPSADPFTPKEHERPDNFDAYELSVQDIIKYKDNLEASFSDRIDKTFIDSIKEVFGQETVEKLAEAMVKGVVKNEELINVIGFSEKAFLSILDDELERTEVLENTNNGTTDLVFVGDINFVDNISVMHSYNSRKKGVEGIVSEEVLGILRSATIAMGNNEFTLTDRGSPIPNKKFTFRGKPENVSIYHEMGIDIVGLANNHAFDYGPDSLTDTLKTLDEAGIARLGAGENLEEAKAAYYYIVNGYKIAIVAGSAIDPYSTRGATENQSGVFQIFNTSYMTKEIEAAKEKADFVIAYVHWGYENTTVITADQKSKGKAFIDAGADVVVGMHSHCMQGVEYYKDKLIVYSLGNFTFSGYDLTCGMLKVAISQDGKIENIYYPMMQKNNFTYINSGEDGKNQLDLLRKISFNSKISDDFVVTAS